MSSSSLGAALAGALGAALAGALGAALPGALGAALTWFALRLLAFLIWPAVVHRRFAPGLHITWMKDVLRISVMTALGLLLGEPLFALLADDDRLHTLLALSVSGSLCLLLVAASFAPLRHRLYLTFTRPSV